MPKHVLIAGFKHETNTFSRMPADIAAYESRGLYRGAEVPAAFAGTRTEIAGFMDACARHGWEPVFATVGDATPSGPVARAAYETITGEILAAAKAQPLIGILLQLHGAMVVEHAEDGEGTLLGLLREALGSEIPIALTLDLHANVTDRMAELADIMVSYRTYPHVDMYEVASEAADLMARKLAGEIDPKTTVVRGQMLDGADHGRTTSPGPMTEVLASAAAFAEEEGIHSITINAGFPWVDIQDTGPSALVVAEAAMTARAEAIGAALIEEIWDKRHRVTIETISVDQAMAEVTAAGAGDGPILLADFADNPGGGGYGDATRLLGGMLAAGLENAAFATVCDPEVAEICSQAGEGAEVTVSLGGKIDPQFGAPLEVTGSVQRLTDGKLVLDGPMAAGLAISMGPTAVLKVGGVEIVVTSGRFQALDQQYLKHAGIDPAAKSVVAVKSAHHFRAAYGPIARKILVVDGGGGLTSRNYKDLPYKKVRRPVYPLDLD